MIGRAPRMWIIVATMPAARNHRPGQFRLLQLLLVEHPELQDLLRKVLAALSHRSPKTPLVKLTRTERIIVDRIVNDDAKFLAIWTNLGMRKRSFDMHLHRIYTKLGVRKRSGLVREAIRRGVV